MLKTFSPLTLVNVTWNQHTFHDNILFLIIQKKLIQEKFSKSSNLVQKKSARSGRIFFLEPLST